MNAPANILELRAELAQLRSVIEVKHEEARLLAANLVVMMRRRDEILSMLACHDYKQRLEMMD